MYGTLTNKVLNILGLWGTIHQKPFPCFSSIWEDSCWGSAKTQVSTIQIKPSYYQTYSKRQNSLYNLCDSIKGKKQGTSINIRYWTRWTPKAHQSSLPYPNTRGTNHHSTRNTKRIQRSIRWSETGSQEPTICYQRSQFLYASNGNRNGKGKWNNIW